MNAAHSVWVDRLSDYLDGNLSDAERVALETHLDNCARCGAVLSDLRAVVEAAGTLADLEPAKDLWPEIATAMEGAGRAYETFPDQRVLRLSEPESSGRPSPRGLFLSVPQLAAAAILLITFSAGATWVAGPGLGFREGVPESPATFVIAAEAPAPPAALASELAALEDLLEGARATLDPNTIRILERNLSVVDQAIEDSRRALAGDPDNEFLAAYLERVFERKLEYLREAARIAEWAG